MFQSLFMVFVLLNVGHAYTTIRIVAKSETEKAPALYHLFNAFGGPLMPLVLVKSGLCFLVYLLVRDNPIALSILDLLFLGVVLHNLMKMSRA